jgi:hypothetical protein
MGTEGKMMKAFLIVLVILVILAGVAFYFGWLQILLPPENYAVVFTKTGGYDEQVIRPGEFVWRWERLIPTNMTLYIFDLHPRTKEVSFQGSLPSADVYSSTLPENPDFSYSGELRVRFSILPERLPTLVSEEKVTPDGLDDFYEAKAEEISGRLLGRLEELDSDQLADLTLNRRLEGELDPEFPNLEISTLNIQSLELPDLELYRLAKQSYRDMVETRDQAREEALARVAEQQVRSETAREQQRADMEVLREYGELLNEYPVLLKAMAVQKLSGERLLTIPEFDLQNILE